MCRVKAETAYFTLFLQCRGRQQQRQHAQRRKSHQMSDKVRKREQLNRILDKWHARFRKRMQFSIRRPTTVGQKFPVSYESLGWAALMKVRTSNMTRAAQIYANRSAAAVVRTVRVRVRLVACVSRGYLLGSCFLCRTRYSAS